MHKEKTNLDEPPKKERPRRSASSRVIHSSPLNQNSTNGDQTKESSNQQPTSHPTSTNEDQTKVSTNQSLNPPPNSTNEDHAKKHLNQQPNPPPNSTNEDQTKPTRQKHKKKKNSK